MAQLSKQALIVENNTSFPNNNTNYITPAILRSFNVDMIDSLVDENGYIIDSGSWNRSISSLNQFTASASGLNTGSLLVTASAVSNVITFTKGDSSQFSVTVADTTNLGPLNAFTASAQISLNNLNLWTSSYQPVITNLQASQSIDNTKWNNLGSQSGSFVTESETGSFARIDASNQFTQQNIFTSISASSFVSASAFVGNGAQLTGITASIALPILDEGIPQGSAYSMNFTGSAISAIVVGGTAVVSVNVPDTGSFNALTASFNTYTSSTDAKFVAVGASTSSLNSFTSSQATKNTTLGTYTSSIDSKFTSVGASTSSLNAYTSSNDTKWSNLSTQTASNAITLNALNSFTASQLTINTAIGASTSSLNTATSSLFTSASLGLVTASVNLNTITFTKGDKSTFAITVNTGSGGGGSTDITSLNAFTASQLTINTAIGASTSSLNTYTSSADSKFVAIGASTASLNAFTQSQDTKNSTLATYTASVNTSLTNINSFTASNGNTSLNSYTASNDTKWNTLGGQTGSYITSAQTSSMSVLSASFAVSASNIYVQNTSANQTHLITFTDATNSYGGLQSTNQFIYNPNTNLLTTTASVAVTLVNGTGSLDNTSLNAFTASQNTKNATLGNLTGSFATTGSNTFYGVQTQVSSSYSGSLINNITPISSSLSKTTNIVTLTASEYAGITPVTTTLYIVI